MCHRRKFEVRERNREAADRTLLAWVRTSLAMISLGFGIERLGQAAVGFDGPLVGFSPFKTSLPLTNLRLEDAGSCRPLAIGRISPTCRRRSIACRPAGIVRGIRWMAESRFSGHPKPVMQSRDTVCG